MIVCSFRIHTLYLLFLCHHHCSSLFLFQCSFSFNFSTRFTSSSTIILANYMIFTFSMNVHSVLDSSFLIVFCFFFAFSMHRFRLCHFCLSLPFSFRSFSCFLLLLLFGCFCSAHSNFPSSSSFRPHTMGKCWNTQTGWKLYWANAQWND